ncbi:hypothetical protein [Pseudomonas aeruginosa]|uniref:hypothetical protein n=1 Tax=Pseudomonas aeruginosa TaxID=287 RepID=UPI00070E71FF|nr:hypothetical protein [Pseudomonas aeruginosa]MCT4934649.1 ornithine cyclodeaminase family protein [Pseudomonas aeruginosa]QTQ99637.1 ornithine cyclodeaminase family protein [Pseudomonas aeruginosa]HCD7566966.1 ornithine cyclodeaminase family protein [Pseudomonas aeruginosa]HCD7570244.1 ornithine cyclodeaminase family protein [Pseudomonas aeruginosa]HCZ9130752.1 ornithine cyclodeaminase family protein [Pseudomonas aeruginosa]
MHILDRRTISDLLPKIDLISCIEGGFVAFSGNRVLSAPVSGMEFTSPPADVHIKSGAICGESHYVVKIASGFYDNPKVGLPSSNGVMLIFSRTTGELEAILLDEGYLTDVRTAAAGALAARQFAPSEVSCIGVLGTGTQARLQVSHLKSVTRCRELMVLGRTKRSMKDYQSAMEGEGFNVHICSSASELAGKCNLIITATPSRSPLLTADIVQPGTHITAVGADTPGKCELDPRLFERADLVVADSVPQCVERGECAAAIQNGCLNVCDISEFGALLSQGMGRVDERDITIVDLTGLAVQDIRISSAVYSKYLETN